MQDATAPPSRTSTLLVRLLLAAIAAGMVGCASGGGSTPSASDDATLKNNFARPATDAEKAKSNAPPMASGSGASGG